MEHPTNPFIGFLNSQLGTRPNPAAPPFTRWLAGVLREVKEGELTMEYTVRPEWANPAGLLHGGVQAAIIDDLIGMAVFTLHSQSMLVTVNLSVNYLQSAKVGEVISAKARVVRHGNLISNAECELYNHAGQLLARATSNLLKTSIPVGGRWSEMRA